MGKPDVLAQLRGLRYPPNDEAADAYADACEEAIEEIVALRARVAEAYALLQETQEYCMDLGLVVRIQKWCSANKPASLACCSCEASAVLPPAGPGMVSIEAANGWTMREGAWLCPRCAGARLPDSADAP